MHWALRLRFPLFVPIKTPTVGGLFRRYIGKDVMAVASGRAPRAQERTIGTGTKVSELVKLEHKVELNPRDAKTTRIQARYSVEPEPDPWWKFWA